VQHRVDAGEQTIECGRIAHVGLLEANTGGWRRRSILVHIGAQRIDSAQVMAAGEQLTKDMLADKPCGSSEQHLHRRYTAIRIVSSADSGVPSAP
jgi:hypothetical protein